MRDWFKDRIQSGVVPCAKFHLNEFAIFKNNNNFVCQIYVNKTNVVGEVEEEQAIPVSTVQTGLTAILFSDSCAAEKGRRPSPPPPHTHTQGTAHSPRPSSHPQCRLLSHPWVGDTAPTTSMPRLGFWLLFTTCTLDKIPSIELPSMAMFAWLNLEWGCSKLTWGKLTSLGCCPSIQEHDVLLCLSSRSSHGVSFLCIYLFFGFWERTKIHLLFHLFMHPLVAPYVHPDRGSNPLPVVSGWCYNQLSSVARAVLL